MNKSTKLLIVQSGCLVLVLFLLIQCKTNQHLTTATVKTSEDGYEYIEFYSKINKATIKVSQYGSSCLKDSLLQSFQYNFLQGISKKWDVRLAYLAVSPLVTDSTACDGLYIYRIRVGTYSARYVNGTPYQLYAIKGNEVLFFSDDDVEGNRKKLETLKGTPVYQEMLKYERNILKNLILIK